MIIAWMPAFPLDTPAVRGRSVVMATQSPATIEDLYRVSGKAELMSGGIAKMSPTGGLHGRVALRIGASLLAYEIRTKTGHAIGDNVGFLVNLPNRRSFSPDVAYHFGPVGVEFVAGSPTFAVEIRSEGDYGPAAEQEVADKRSDYFAAGTVVVWDVDPLGTDVIVSVFRASDPDHPTLYRRGEIAEAEPAVPGWTMPVDEMFPVE
jgi:Uma2 family endonuclease